MKNFLGLFILMILLVGCASIQVEPTSTPSPLPPSATSTPTLTPTSTPTNTPSPTPTPLELPVLNGTPVPLSNIPISVENVDKVTELARYWGNPDAVVRTTRDGKTLVIANVEGIYVYDIPTSALIKAFNAHIYFNHFDGWQPLATKAINFMDISADGQRIAFLTNDESIRVLDISGKDVLNIHLEKIDSDLFPYSNLAISPNGKTLAVANGQRLLVFDVESGQKISVDGIAGLVCFTGDGNYLIAGPKLIYTTSDWQKIPTIATKLNIIISFACDPNSSQLAILSDTAVEVWDINSGQSLAAIQLFDKLYPRTRNAPTEIRFSADSTQLITFNRFGAKYDRHTVAGLIEIASGQLIDLIDNHPYCGSPDCVDPVTVGAIEDLTVSSNGKLVPIIVGINPLSLPWLGMLGGLNTNREPTIFGFLGSGNDQHVALASSYDRFVCEVGINGMSHCPYFYDHYELFIHLLADNEYYSYGLCDETLLRGLYWGGNEVVSLDPIPGCENQVRFFGYSPQFDVVLYVIRYEYGTQGNKMFLYDIANNKKIFVWDFPRQSLSYGIMSPDGRYAAILFDRERVPDQVMVYDLSTKQLIFNEILKDKFQIEYPSLAFSDDSKTLSLFGREYDLGNHSVLMGIRIWDMNNNFNLVHYEIPVARTLFNSISPSDFVVSPDSKLVAAGMSNGAILLIDLSKGSLVREITAHTGPILRLAFNEDGSLLASLERSGIVKIWGIAP